MTLLWLPSLEDLEPQLRKGTKEERELIIRVFRLFGSVFLIKRNKNTNVAALMYCKKSFLETEWEKEKYLAILRYSG